MIKKLPTLAIVLIIGAGAIITAWIINPGTELQDDLNDEQEMVKIEETKIPLKTLVDKVEIFWYGHASFKIQSGGAAVYFDPYKIERDISVDLVLITHPHADHLDPNSIVAVSDGNTTVVVPESGKEKLPEGEFGIKVLSVGDTMQNGDFTLQAVEAYNNIKSFHPKGEGVGYILTFEDVVIYHAGDTDFIEEMKKLPDIDVALLPIGGTYTMDEEEALEAVKIIKPRIVIPMHYGTLPETPGDPEKFKQLVGDIAEVRILR